MEFHEIANIFPLMEGSEFEDLVSDIKSNGLIDPVWLYEGKILDGRNRYRACQEAGVEPQFQRYLKSNPLGFVISTNIHRRHLNESQRAVIASTLANMRQGQRTDIEPSANLRKVISQPEAAKMLNVSERSMQSVKAIEREAPELIPEIVRGELTAHQATKKVKIRKRDEAQETIKLQSLHSQDKPIIYNQSWNEWLETQPQCDLLITDPPYMTDVENIDLFVDWLPSALKKVKPTGFAYIFIGGYPEEIRAYLNVCMPTQLLIWTYRNTLGQNPKEKYKLNYQAILFYRMAESPSLDCPLTAEQWAVQDINAPDGRLGNRYFKWQKPDELAERFIRHTTKKGDFVLDCFAGAGTFLLASTRLGRKAAGCDIDKDAIDIACNRGCHIG